MSEILKVFVYGTLKPGETNYDCYCRDHVLASQAAFVFGQLYGLPLGYPAMELTFSTRTTSTLLNSGSFVKSSAYQSSNQFANQSPVYGFVLSFAEPEVLTLLDELEDYKPDRPLEQNEYIRVETEAFTLDQQSLGQVWVYQMEPWLIKKLGGVFLPQGIWYS